MLYSTWLSGDMIQAWFMGIFFSSFDAELDLPPGIQLLRSLPRPSASLDCLEAGLGSRGEDTVRAWSAVEPRYADGCAELLLTRGAAVEGRLVDCSFVRPSLFLPDGVGGTEPEEPSLALDVGELGSADKASAPASEGAGTFGGGGGGRCGASSGADDPLWCFCMTAGILSPGWGVG